MAILRNVSLFIEINGLITEFFLVDVGVGQGNPFASFIFILCIEFLILRILQDPATGFNLPLTLKKICCTAHIDDLNMFANSLIARLNIQNYIVLFSETCKMQFHNC